MITLSVNAVFSYRLNFGWPRNLVGISDRSVSYFCFGHATPFITHRWIKRSRRPINSYRCPHIRKEVFDLQMAHYDYHFLSFLLMNIFLSTFSSNCNVLYNIQVIPGHRCFVDRQVYLSITPTHHYSCRHNCITNKRCSYVQHHVVRNNCIVSNGPCLWLEPDTNYNVTVIRTKSVEECVKWVPQISLINAARRQDTCITWEKEDRVGRINIQSNILVGKGVVTQCTQH